MGHRDKRERYRSAELNRGDYRGDFGPEGFRRFDRRDDPRHDTDTRPRAPHREEGPQWERMRQDRTAGGWQWRGSGREGWHREREGWNRQRPFGSESEAWTSGAGFRPAGFGFGPEEEPGRGGFVDDDWQVTRPARGRGQWAGDWEDNESVRHRDDQTRGDYRGRGPRGYRRADDRIREEVCDRLTDDWSVDASEIDVSVLEGEVTLSGTVASREQKRRAEACVEQIRGVRDVINQLRVGNPPNVQAQRGGGIEAPSVAADSSRRDADSRQRNR